MKKLFKKINNRNKRILSIRKTLMGSTERPRVTVFRSNNHIYAQVIDDVKHVTLASASDAKITKKAKPADIAKEVGKELGEKILKAKIEKVVFDRRGYKYHGRVKALADGIREAGVVF
jgi:large subunit ribosomal protein L18